MAPSTPSQAHLVNIRGVMARIVVLAANPGRIAQVIDVPFADPWPAELREPRNFCNCSRRPRRASVPCAPESTNLPMKTCLQPTTAGLGLVARWYAVKHGGLGRPLKVAEVFDDRASCPRTCA